MPSVVFITGPHRSGTSLLHLLLADHPHASGFSNTGVPEDEGQHLQDVIPTAATFGGPGHFGFDPRAAMDESHPLCTPASAARILQCWSPHWRASAAIHLEKSPPTALRTRFFQGLFPDARFLLLLRHPAAVAYATLKLRRAPILHLVEHTLRIQERMLADAAHLRRHLIVRYEDLAARPPTELARIHAFLGLDPRPPTRPILPDRNSHYLAAWSTDAAFLRTSSAAARTTLDALHARAHRIGYSLIP